MRIFRNLSLQSNTILIIVSIGLVKAPMVIRDILLTYYFGIDKTLDLYFYSLMFPAFFLGILSGGLTAFFIPFYLNLKKEKGDATARWFTGQIFLFMAAIVIFLAVSLGYWLPNLTERLNSGFLGQQFDLYCILSRLSWAFFIFSMLGAFLASVLQAEHRYFQSLYPQMLIAGMSIVLTIMFYKSLGVVAAILGSALGAMMCLVAYCSCCKKEDFFPRSSKPSERIPIQLDQFWILILIFSIPSVIPLIDQHMASTLGEGKLSIYNYGTRIPDGLADILSSGLGMAVFSHFSQWRIENRNHLIVDAIRKAIMLSTLFVVPLCAFLLIFAQPVISIIFERGAFSADATLAVSRVLQFQSFFTYVAILNILGVRAIFAMRKNGFLLLATLIVLSIKIILNFFFIKFFDVAGLALANLGALLSYCCLIYCFLAGNKMYIFEKSFIARLSVCCLSVGGVVVILWFTSQILSSLTDLHKISIGLGVLSVTLILILKILITHKIIDMSEVKSGLLLRDA